MPAFEVTVIVLAPDGETAITEVSDRISENCVMNEKGMCTTCNEDTFLFVGASCQPYYDPIDLVDD